LLNPFKIYLGATVLAGEGQVLTRHLVTAGLTTVQVGQNGQLIIQTTHIPLINDPDGALMAAVVEGTAETGAGRVLVFGDCDMFGDLYMTDYPEDLILGNNVAAWALRTSHAVTGHAALADYGGSTDGLPISFEFYVGSSPVAYVETALDASGDYWFVAEVQGIVNIVGKPSHWTSVRHIDVSMDGEEVPQDWTFLYNGDVDGDDLVGLVDLNRVLLAFGSGVDVNADVNGSGLTDLPDLNVVLVNFGKEGDG
jgi:hypothetical protein